VLKVEKEVPGRPTQTSLLALLPSLPFPPLFHCRIQTPQLGQPSPPFLSCTLPLPRLRSRPLNTARAGLGERCKLPQLGLGRSPSGNNQLYSSRKFEFGAF